MIAISSVAEMHVSVAVKSEKEEVRQQTTEEKVFFVNEKGEKILVLLKTINF